MHKLSKKAKIMGAGQGRAGGRMGNPGILYIGVGYHRASLLHIFHGEYAEYALEDICKFLDAFWGAGSCINWQSNPSALAADSTPKSGQIPVIQCNISCMYMCR